MKMVFIVGIGRSGTSLLQSMLGAHPEITALVETSFLRRYIITGESSVVGLSNDKKIDRNPVLRRALQSDRLTVPDFIDAYRNSLKGHCTSHILDKDPRLVESIPQLYKLFPDCRIIHIVRDPRDVLASKKKADWSSNRSLLNYLIVSRLQLTSALDAEKTYQIHTLKYEDLLENSERELRNICRYIGIEFSADSLDYVNTAKQLTSDEELAWKKETFGPVLKNNAGKWQGSITTNEAISFEYTLPQLFKRAGYKGTLKNATLRERIGPYVMSIVARLLSTLFLVRMRIKKKSVSKQYPREF